MKINKLLYLLSAVLLTGFAACSDDVEYTPAKAVPEDCMQVYFTNASLVQYKELMEVAPENCATTKFKVELSRIQTAEAASVPIEVSQAGGMFVVPATAEFAAGQAKTTIDITLSKNDLGQYNVSLQIVDNKYADPYTILGGSVLFGLNIDVVKWNLIGTGTFTYAGWFEGTDPTQKLYQKDGTNLYKFPEWGGGVTLFFTCDDTNKIWVEKQLIGASHNSYGAVSIASTSKGVSSYNPATKTYSFNCEYVVDAGTFGLSPEKFVLDKPGQ